MAERPNALVLKTSEGHTSGGSNPPASAVESLPGPSLGEAFAFLAAAEPRAGQYLLGGESRCRAERLRGFTSRKAPLNGGSQLGQK